MSTMDIKIQNKDDEYLITIKGIRSRNFSRNLPFLILSDKLPEGQVYREFSDGHIELQQVSISGSKYQYKLIRILPATESDKIRKSYGLC